MRMKAVTSKASKLSAKSAMPKFATLPNAPASPVVPLVVVVWRTVTGVWSAVTAIPARVSAANTTAGITMRGARSGPTSNGRTPLESSAITNTNRIRIAPL